MTGLVIALVVAVLVLIACLVVLTVWVRQLYEELAKVRALEAHGFEVLNKRITDEVVGIKGRLIDTIGHTASNTVNVRDSLREEIGRQMTRQQNALDRELVRRDKEIVRSLAALREDVERRLVTVETEGGGRPAWVESTVESSEPPVELPVQPARPAVQPSPRTGWGIS